MKNAELKKHIVHYDRKSDVFYIGIKKGVEEEFVEIAPGVSVELDKNGEVIGIEVLNASQVFKPVVKTVKRKIAEPVAA